jgi:membrane-bound lytic murein transglycosylase F
LKNSSAIYKIFRERRAIQFIIVVLWVIAITYLFRPIVDEYKFVTLHKIIKAGQITIITRNTPHCYYIYRDEPMGFEYELAREFAEYLGVELKVNLAESWEGMIPELNDGAGALIAAGMTITPRRQNQVSFSNGYMDIQQHLIAHRNSPKIKSLADLSGKKIHVRQATAYQERLEELQQQGMELTIELHNDMPTEELIQQVAQREIELTMPTAISPCSADATIPARSWPIRSVTCSILAGRCIRKPAILKPKSILFLKSSKKTADSMKFIINIMAI